MDEFVFSFVEFLDRREWHIDCFAVCRLTLQNRASCKSLYPSIVFEAIHCQICNSRTVRFSFLCNEVIESFRALNAYGSIEFVVMSNSGSDLLQSTSASRRRMRPARNCNLPMSCLRRHVACDGGFDPFAQAGCQICAVPEQIPRFFVEKTTWLYRHFENQE